MRPTRPIMTFVGIGVAAAGFVVILFAWGKVAAQTAVPLQLPYLVSGGLVGLALVMVGVTLVNVQAKREDAAYRERQMDQLSEVLGEIRVLLGGEPRASTVPVEPAQDAPVEDATDQLPVFEQATNS